MMNRRILIIYSFVLVCAVFLVVRSDLLLFVYPVLLLLVLYSLQTTRFDEVALRCLGFSALFSLAVYSWLAPIINSLELWGDEIGVIQIAGSPFGQIASLVATTHIAVPPLDYWNLWLWSHAVLLFSVQYQEILYRLPYMAFHALSAGFFGLLMAKPYKVNRPTTSLFVYAVSFLAYFLNPLLFYYALEVRFYSLSAAGSLLILAYFIHPEAYRPRHIFLLLLLCLNSASQVFMTAVMLIRLYLSRRSSVLFHSVITVLALALLIRQHTFVFGTASSDVLNLVVWVARSFIKYQFPSRLHAALFACVGLFLVYKRDRQARTVMLFGLIFFLFISAAAYLYGYFDFHVRHYAFLSPWMLYVLIRPLKYSKGSLTAVFLLSIVLLFILPWGQQVYTSLSTGSLISKTFVGGKAIANIAADEGKSIVLLPLKKGSNLTASVFDFYSMSLLWYAERYGVHAEKTKNAVWACRRYENGERVVLVSLTGSIECLPETKQRYVYSTFYSL